MTKHTFAEILLLLQDNLEADELSSVAAITDCLEENEVHVTSRLLKRVVGVHNQCLCCAHVYREATELKKHIRRNHRYAIADHKNSWEEIRARFSQIKIELKKYGEASVYQDALNKIRDDKEGVIYEELRMTVDNFLQRHFLLVRLNYHN